MRKGLVVIALAGGLLTGFHCEVSVAGSAYDGNELLRQCQQYIRAADDEKNYDRIDAGMCGGFIQGVDSTFAMLGDNLKKDARLCMPQGVTNSQLVRVVVKYLKDNPKLLNLHKVALSWAALRDAYPCK